MRKALTLALRQALRHGELQRSPAGLDAERHPRRSRILPNGQGKDLAGDLDVTDDIKGRSTATAPLER
jgi:hypothetical protein